ncbi:MAG: Sodium-dependent dicarboxylate transporter SdcS [Ignavibacteriaceae bacterium]|nr:Sodium-dependent dicarboxylate transporter SdcS [Ignavibacteriaceae bacterium]
MLGILAFLVFILISDLPDHPRFCAGIAILMSIWWVTEAVPLAVTSLVPLVLFPLTGVISGKDAAAAYTNSTIFLFLGGFIIALAMERWNLHKRIALGLVSRFGKSPSSIVLSFMVAGGFLSMWISNTATAVMLLPIGMAIVSKMSEEHGSVATSNFSKALMLSIAYSASIGGIATYIGTPPNLVFQRIYAQTFPNNASVGFGQWIIWFFPLAVLLTIFVWWLLTKVIFRSDGSFVIDRSIMRTEYEGLGRMKYEEKVILTVFASAAVLWIFREDIAIGAFTIKGWANIFPAAKFIDDGTVSIFAAVLLFIIPKKKVLEEGGAIVDGWVIQDIPWDVILLFGGGFALAEGFVKSGLSEAIGKSFDFAAGMPVIFIIFSISLIVTFLTELTSNTATAQIFLPILAAFAIEWKVDPLLLMLPATISASMAFMMPVATPPNAIVFGSRKLQIADMAKTGFFINIFGAVVITLLIYFVLGLR